MIIGQCLRSRLTRMWLFSLVLRPIRTALDSRSGLRVRGRRVGGGSVARIPVACGSTPGQPSGDPHGIGACLMPSNEMRAYFLGRPNADVSLRSGLAVAAANRKLPSKPGAPLLSQSVSSGRSNPWCFPRQSAQPSGRIEVQIEVNQPYTFRAYKLL